MVNGTFGAPGGTLTGTFTTNDAITQVTAVDLFSSSNGAFQGFEYDDVATIDSQREPNSFRITLNPVPGHTDQLQLVFTPALTIAGSAIGTNSFEHQDFQGSGNRILSGTVKVSAAVPEPASWALMIAGFGLAGAALRTRRRQTLAAAA
jgi:hypothetical protein